MSSTHVLVLSVACILAGTILLICKASEAMASTLIVGGIGGFSREVAVAKQEKRKQEQRAEEALNETREIARELFEATGIMRKPQSQDEKPN